MIEAMTEIDIERPVVAIIVTKRNPLVTLGRPQKYRWKAVNWGNHKTLAISSEAYTNNADALAAAIQLFGDDTTDQALIDSAGFRVDKPFRAANVYLIQDGKTGMTPLRINEAA